MSNTVLMLLTNPFLPDPRPHKEAKILVKEGYQVHIIAWDRNGESRLEEKTVLDGINITRIISSGAYGKGIQSLSSFWSFYRKAVRMGRIMDPDIIYCHDLDTMIPGYLLARRKKKKLILDLHEFYEGMLMRSNPFLRKFFVFFLTIMKRIIYRKVSGIVYTNEILREYDCDKLKLKVRKSILLKNYPEKKFIDNIKRVEDKTITFGFFGNIREYEILENIANCIEKSHADMKLKVAGTGPDADAIRNLFSGCRKSTFSGAFDAEMLAELYRDVDIVICLYTKNPSTVSAFPVKFFEAYQMNIPVITFSGTALGDFVTEHDIGYVIDDFNEIKSVINSIDNKNNLIYSEKMKKLKKEHDFYFENQKEDFLSVFITE